MSPAEAIATGQDVTGLPDGTAEVAGVALPGLPDGVLAVEYRIPIAGEYLFANKCVHSPPMGWHAECLIVKPAPGWDFVYDIQLNNYKPARQYGTPKRIAVHFLVRNSSEEAAVRALKSNVGFEGFEE